MKSLKTFFYSLKKSLFEPKYYFDVAKVKFSFSFKYLWFLLLILTTIKVFSLGGEYINFRPKIKPGVDKIMKSAQTIYPNELELKINSGQLSTNVQEPYIFDFNQKTNSNERHLVIIDTLGSIEDYPSYNTYVLATKNAVVYPSKSRNSQIEQTSVYYFKDLKQNISFNKSDFDKIIRAVTPYTKRVLFFVDLIAIAFIFLFFIFGSLFWTGGVMFTLIFLTFFVWIINLIFKKKYNYGSLFKMGMHAVTWSILTSEVIGYFRSPFPKLYSVIFLVWMLIILFQKSSSKKRA